VIHKIKNCVSDRNEVGYCQDHAASLVAGEPVYLNRLVWAHAEPEVKYTVDKGLPTETTVTIPAREAGYAIPGWERRVAREEAMRISEQIARAIAGY
jgi:hypothetical protein